MEHITLSSAISFIPAIAGISGVGGAWFHARYGRKVRVKVGDIEVEAQTVRQVEKLLNIAEALQHRNDPRIVQ